MNISLTMGEKLKLKMTPFSISQIPPTNHHGAHTPPNLQVIIPSHSKFRVEKVISSISSVNIFLSDYLAI